jgi:hypothetical protein
MNFAENIAYKHFSTRYTEKHSIGMEYWKDQNISPKAQQWSLLRYDISSIVSVLLSNSEMFP